MSKSELKLHAKGEEDHRESLQAEIYEQITKIINRTDLSKEGKESAIIKAKQELEENVKNTKHLLY